MNKAQITRSLTTNAQVLYETQWEDRCFKQVWSMSHFRETENSNDRG